MHRTKPLEKQLVWLSSRQARFLGGLCASGDIGNPGSSRDNGVAYALPIAVTVTLLLAIVTISYQQTVRAYPGVEEAILSPAITWEGCSANGRGGVID
jgi:hypothetical protein